MDRTSIHAPTVDDIQRLDSRGPWRTKSGGDLMQILQLPLPTVASRYLRYDLREVGRLSTDIRGLRIYTVQHLPVGEVGGNEWHRVREEVVMTTGGSVRWSCLDVYGGRRNFTVPAGEGLWLPPLILHLYQVNVEASSLLIVANTLFHDDPATHDTYPLESFSRLSREYRALSAA